METVYLMTYNLIVIGHLGRVTKRGSLSCRRSPWSSNSRGEHHTARAPYGQSTIQPEHHTVRAPYSQRAREPEKPHIVQESYVGVSETSYPAYVRRRHVKYDISGQRVN